MIVDQAEFVGSWNSFFDDDRAMISLATFAYAQGKKVDISTTPNTETIYKYGFKLLLCFHYSDFGAAPTIQQLPKAWKKDSSDPEKIADDIYNFTADAIHKFQPIGADIVMMQIGNEIIKGMCEVMQISSYTDLWGEGEKAKKITSYLKCELPKIVPPK